MTDDDDLEPKKTSRATTIRRAIVALLVLACAGGLVYTRYIVKKGGLGETCTYDMHCNAEAPRCLKQAVDGDGVCSRPCDTDADCAAGIKCVKVELDDRDERGRPLEGGYCFPQALLDARRKKPQAEAGAKSDSWLDVPEVAGQLEGEIAIERGTTKATYEVKGTLVRAANKKTRTIIDTSTLRVYSVDDEKKTFSATQLAAMPGEVTVTKTDRKDDVAGRECEVWQIEDPAGSGKLRDACVLKGGALIDPTARSAAPWEKELAVRAVFPLRITDGDKPKVVATKVDLHPLDASLFAIPKTYKNLAAR